MKATILDLRRRMRDVFRALDRNEPVVILYRGRERGVIYPSAKRSSRGGLSLGASVAKHPAFGLWKDRDDMKNVPAVVRKIRKGRFHAL